MSTTRPSVGYHILALVTIAVWGTTFVSTKVLLAHGLTPPEIMFYRFIIAYALTWVFARKLWADTWKDELLLAVAGFTGGTLYFLAENTAIDYSITSNVALVVCVTPVLTALLTSLCYKERITARLVVGSVVSLLGVGFVVLNGTVLQIHPLGDALALVAAFAWAVYSVVVRRFDGRYTIWFVTPLCFASTHGISCWKSSAPCVLPTICTPSLSCRSPAPWRYWANPSLTSPFSAQFLYWWGFMWRSGSRRSIDACLYFLPSRKACFAT